MFQLSGIHYRTLNETLKPRARHPTQKQPKQATRGTLSFSDLQGITGVILQVLVVQGLRFRFLKHVVSLVVVAGFFGLNKIRAWLECHTREM